MKNINISTSAESEKIIINTSIIKAKYSVTHSTKKTNTNLSRLRVREAVRHRRNRVSTADHEKKINPGDERRGQRDVRGVG